MLALLIFSRLVQEIGCKRVEQFSVLDPDSALEPFYIPVKRSGLSWISQAAHNDYQQIIRNKVSLLVFTQLCPASVSVCVGTHTVSGYSVC